LVEKNCHRGLQSKEVGSGHRKKKKITQDKEGKRLKPSPLKALKKTEEASQDIKIINGGQGGKNMVGKESKGKLDKVQESAHGGGGVGRERRGRNTKWRRGWKKTMLDLRGGDFGEKAVGPAMPWGRAGQGQASKEAEGLQSIGRRRGVGVRLLSQNNPGGRGKWLWGKTVGFSSFFNRAGGKKTRSTVVGIS